MSGKTKTQQLEKLEAKVQAASRAERDVRMQYDQATAALKGAREALATHLSGDDPDVQTERRLHVDVTKARNAVEKPEWEAKLSGAQRKLRRVEMERDRYNVDHFGELVGEVVPEAVKVAEALEAQVAGIEDALETYAQVEQRVIRLTRPVQAIDGSDVPSAGIEVLRSEARRVLDAGIPAPLPRSLTDQADPTIRSAA